MAKKKKELFKDNKIIKLNEHTLSIYRTFNNELFAWSVRRQWIKIFKNYFFLEDKRDYKFEVISHSDGNFVLEITFNSSCGRYALWRIINDHVSEVVQKLAI